MLIKLRYNLNQDSHALCLKNNQPLSFTLCSLCNVWSWESIILFCDFISSQIGRKAQLWSSKQFASVSRWEEIKSQRSSEKQSSTLPQKELSLNFKTGFDNNLTLDHFFPHPNFLLALTDSSASDPTIRSCGISFLSQRLIITFLGLIFSYVLHVKL